MERIQSFSRECSADLPFRHALPDRRPRRPAGSGRGLSCNLVRRRQHVCNTWQEGDHHAEGSSAGWQDLSKVVID